MNTLTPSRQVLLWLAASLLAIFTSGPLVASIQQAYYVSPSGSDSNPGTSSQPFQTLAHAQAQVRAINGSMTGDIVVYVGAGTYALTSTLSFDETDSGTSGHQVIYQNWNAVGSAVILGSKPVTGWTLYSGNIYVANIGTTWKPNVIYENGVRAVKARTPNINASWLQTTTAQSGYLFASYASGGSSNISVHYTAGDIDPTMWSSNFDKQIYVWPGISAPWNANWFSDLNPITGYDAVAQTVTGSHTFVYPVYDKSRYFVQGDLSMLDQPGEFCVDNSGHLYYWPRKAPIASQTIDTPILLDVVSIAGSSSTAQVHDFALQGISIGESDFTNEWKATRTTGHDGLEWSGTRHALLYLGNANHIEINYCHFKNAGISGILLDQFSTYNTLYGNFIEKTGYDGIMVLGGWPGTGDMSNYNNIDNNLVTWVGLGLGHASGLNLNQTGHNIITHNVFYHSPRYSVRFAAAANMTNYNQNNALSYVYAKYACEDSGDTAAIYSFGDITATQSNSIEQTIVDYCYADPSMNDQPPHGLYFDWAASYWTVTNMKITNTQSLPYVITTATNLTLTNVSWNGGFDGTLMAYDQIGLRNDFPLEYGGSTANPDSFRDGFESGFTNWSTISGTPTTSTVQTHGGAKSYILNSDQCAIQHTLPSLTNKVAVVWLYDNASATTGSAMMFVDDNISAIGLGVYNTASTGYYVYRIGSTFTATAVPRTTGWHQFVFDYTSKTNVKLYIDSVTAPVATSLVATAFNRIALGDFWGDTHGMTAYYDDISVQSNLPPTLFAEGFETGFGSWINLLGTAMTSGTQAHSGSLSYLVNTAQSAIQHNLSDVVNKVAVVWLYDNASVTAASDFAFVDDNVSAVGMGVYTATSGNKYVYRFGSTFAATSVTRTTGWHRLIFDYTSGIDVKLYIDTTTTPVATWAATTSFSRIAVGNFWPDGHTMTAYFDDIVVQDSLP